MSNQAVSIEAMLEQAITHHQQNRMADAEQGYRQVLAVAPNHPVALGLLAVIAHQHGDHATAETLLRQAIAIHPGYGEAYCNLGSVLGAQNRDKEAEEAYAQAVALTPDLVEAHTNLGNLKAKTGRRKEAVAHYMRAIELSPNCVEAILNMGTTYRELGHVKQARQCFEKLLALLPNFPEGHNNLGSLYAEAGMLEKAAQSYERALALKPDYAEARTNLGSIYLEQGEQEKAMRCFEMVPDFKPEYHIAASNILFSMHYDPAKTPEELLQAALAWAQKHAPVSLMQPVAADKNPDRKLRIGYVSADFREHPVGYFMEGVLGAHDPQQVEVFCYATQSLGDAMTGRLREKTLHWHEIYGMPDETAAALIREHKIDILIDLSGHTGGGRLPMFARKPAPVQMTWLGYFDTTGMKAMDYVICDQHVVPQNLQKYFVENPLYLPNYLCFTPPPYDVAISEPPCVKNGYVTFGNFHKLNKITPEVMGCWAELLAKVPDSRLLVKSRGVGDEQTTEKLKQQFTKAGVSMERVTLEGYTPRKDMFEAYNRVDIVPDTFPYNGGTTTAEAIWMGVPVVIWPHDRFAGRISLSLVRTLGMEEWIAGSREEYIEKLATLALDTARLKDYRAGLRAKLLASHLCDAKGFTKNLEAGYREAWRRYCRA